jgi:hypothetical protein
MIAEVNSASAHFFYENAEGTGLEPTGGMVPIEDLAQCAAEDVPERLGFTPAQLAEMGYE